MRGSRVDPAKLAFRPPKQEGPTNVELDAGTFYNHTFGDAEDAVIKLPASNRVAKIKTEGGRHLRAVGGKVVVKAGETGGFWQSSLCTGSVSLEGLHIDGNGNNMDLIEVGGTAASPFTHRPSVFLRNILAENIVGSEGTKHADLFQPQQAMGDLCVDRFTGESGYQGFFIPPQKPIRSAHIRRANFRYGPASEESPITYLLWLASASLAPYPVYLGEGEKLSAGVFIEPRPGQILKDHCVWPKAGQKNEAGEPIGAEAVVVSGHNAVKFPAASGIHGYVFEGPPPGGDFVKPADCGLGYVSPGNV